MTNETNSRERDGMFTARKMTVTAVMSAVAVLLMMLKFPVPLMPPFIKMDFGELPALITAYALGPFHATLVCLIKNLANVLMTGTDSTGVGELSNFLLGVCFVVPAGVVYRFMRDRQGAIVGSIVGALSMAMLSIPTNYFIIYPLYTVTTPMEVIMGAYQKINPSITNLFQALLIFNAPFTFIKGLSSALICFMVYKRISQLIKGK